jgi:hypothetical protein
MIPYALGKPLSGMFLYKKRLAFCMLISNTVLLEDPLDSYNRVPGIINMFYCGIYVFWV